MAELAIHDPHYFHVESNQKTAIVHLFHNPIPADGPRNEGPEWARAVDDIYLKATLNGSNISNFFDVRATVISLGDINEIKLTPPTSTPEPVKIKFRNETSDTVKMCGLIHGQGSLSALMPCYFEYPRGVSEFNNYDTVSIDDNRYLVFTSKDDKLGFFDNISDDELPVITSGYSGYTSYYIKISRALLSKEIVIRSV